MSDSMRQSTTDKVSSSLKPDSQKSTLEQASDSAKSTMDSVAGSLQPESEKSTTQKISDSTSSGSKDAQKEGQSLYQQAADTVNAGVQQASDALGLNKK